MLAENKYMVLAQQNSYILQSVTKYLRLTLVFMKNGTTGKV